jgi:hypothetical protein
MLSAASMMLGQVVKASFTYAPMVGFFSGGVFIILGLYTAFQTYAENKHKSS